MTKKLYIFVLMRLYRYVRVCEEILNIDDRVTGYEYSIGLQEFTPHKETECFYFITVKGKEKRIGKTSTRTFAYTCKKKAMKSFFHRSRHALWYAEHSLKAGNYFFNKSKELYERK